MNVVEPYWEIYNDGADPDKQEEFTEVDGIRLVRKVEHYARISHRSEEAQTAISWDRFLRAVVLNKGDWSVVEHASLSVTFYVDRGITHEIVRHRLASYTQESTRFVNYAKKMSPSFIYPRPQDLEQDPDWKIAIEACEDGYQRLIAKGWTAQEARSVFPNALGSKIAMTCNLRNWRHYLLMRSTREAHPQMRQVIDPLLLKLKATIPIFFEDIEAGATQADNLKKMR
ncbi:MAG: FAD-dependent thymidylate synthase [Nitrospirota bacterium]|nr:FAD-dependent thymidylate synthase [Nitrospirota bacterium]